MFAPKILTLEQDNYIKTMKGQKEMIFLNSHWHFKKIIQLGLLPESCQLDPNAAFSEEQMFETILSVLLEHKCLSLLIQCAENWRDKKFTILTTWVLKRSNQIRSRCSQLDQSLFQNQPWAENDKKEYKKHLQNMEYLIDLQQKIRKSAQLVLPPKAIEEMQFNEDAMRKLYKYQRFLMWLINRGVLPQTSAVEAMLRNLRSTYAQRRDRFKDRDSGGGGLYIDALIKHLKSEEELRELWNDSYPPPSLAALLRVITVPSKKVSLEDELLLYFLLDVQKHLPMALTKVFAMSFRVRERTVQSVTSFWHLDQGEHCRAVLDIYKAGIFVHNYEEWQTKLLLEVLLTNGAYQPALRLLRRPPGPVPPLLHLKILMASGNIGSSFEYARDNNLLDVFFSACIKEKKFKVLEELSLKPNEEQIAYRALCESNTEIADQVHIILVLKKFKYIDAVTLMDEIGKRKKTNRQHIENCGNILDLYRSKLTPLEQTITDGYLKMRNNPPNMQENVITEPLSSYLAKLDNQLEKSDNALSTDTVIKYLCQTDQCGSISQDMPFLYPVLNNREHNIDDNQSGNTKQLLLTVPNKILEESLESYAENTDKENTLYETHNCKSIEVEKEEKESIVNSTPGKSRSSVPLETPINLNSYNLCTRLKITPSVENTPSKCIGSRAVSEPPITPHRYNLRSHASYTPASVETPLKDSAQRLKISEQSISKRKSKTPKQLLPSDMTESLESLYNYNLCTQLKISPSVENTPGKCIGSRAVSEPPITPHRYNLRSRTSCTPISVKTPLEDSTNRLKISEQSISKRKSKTPKQLLPSDITESLESCSDDFNNGAIITESSSE